MSRLTVPFNRPRKAGSGFIGQLDREPKTTKEENMEPVEIKVDLTIYDASGRSIQTEVLLTEDDIQELAEKKAMGMHTCVSAKANRFSITLKRAV